MPGFHTQNYVSTILCLIGAFSTNSTSLFGLRPQALTRYELGNGKETGDEGQKREEAESTLMTTPTTPVTMETIPATRKLYECVFF